MIKDLRNFYVLDVIVPEIVWKSKNNNHEQAKILKNHICKKEIDEDGEVIYIDLEMNMRLNVIEELGCIRVDRNSIRPLSLYYNFLGVPKINVLENRESVSVKIRS